MSSLLTSFPGLRRIVQAFVVAGLVAGQAACGDTNGFIPMGPVIMLTPPSASLAVGDSTVFYVTTVPKTGVRWISSDPAVATVSATGVVRAIAVGGTTITVSQVPDPSMATAALVVVHAP